MVVGKRTLKVHSSGAYSELNVPCIILQGKWLRRLGFKTGDHVIVKEGDGVLVIWLVQEKSHKDQQ